MEVDKDGGKGPFPGSPGPTLVPQPMDTHPPSAVRGGLGSHLCPPALLSPSWTSHLHACPAFLQGGSPSPHTPPHPSEGQGSRAGTWAGYTDGMTRRALVFRGHRGGQTGDKATLDIARSLVSRGPDCNMEHLSPYTDTHEPPTHTEQTQAPKHTPTTLNHTDTPTP